MIYKNLIKVEAEILELYSKYKNILDITKNSIYGRKIIKKILKKNNIIHYRPKRKRQFPINENYFSEINSHEKAYYLGLFYADGHVIWNEKEKQFGIKISLTHDDSYILKQLNESIRYGRELKTYKYKNNKGRPATHLWVYSKKIAENLISLGCVPKKSLILKFPLFLDLKYMPCFLRGYFDGDGGISFLYPRISIRITSSHDFCNGIGFFLQKELGITSWNITNRGNFSDYVINKKIDKIKFYKYIYKNTEFKTHLKRKKEKFEKVFDHLDNLSTRKKLNKNQLAIMELGKTVL